MLNFFFAILFIPFPAGGNQPIPVLSQEVVITSQKHETLYFGLANGDRAVVEIEEASGRSISDVEFNVYAGQVLFSRKRVRGGLADTISVHQTGVYALKLSNTGLRRRSARVAVSRIPGSDVTRNFNTHVTWQTVHDTTWYKAAEYVSRGFESNTVQVVLPQIITLAGSLSLTTPSKQVYSISLPPNTTEWIYQFEAIRDEQKEAEFQQFMSLADMLSNYDPRAKLVMSGINLINETQSGISVSAFHLHENNPQNFYSMTGEYNYYPGGSVGNLARAQVHINYGHPPVTYLGFQNKGLKEINLTFEVMAITRREIFEEMEVDRFTVHTETMPVLIED